MKKFLKFILGVGTVIAAIGGIMYFLKNVLMKDYLDDFDDDDFDNDLYDEEDSENRDYVTINVPDKESKESIDSSDSSDSSESKSENTQDDDLSAFDSVTD